MTVRWNDAPRKHEFKTLTEFAAMNDEYRAAYIKSLELHIRFTAAKLERYKAKVRQLEEQDRKMAKEREDRQR
jgi:hypothetical protein